MKAASHLLTASHVLVRARWQIDIIRLGAAVLLEGQGNHEAASWVPSATDLSLPATEEQLLVVARRAVYAFARSARIPAWDPTA